MNPGAVSISEGDYLKKGTFSPGPVGARFAILDWDGQMWNATFHITPYDLHALRLTNEETGFLSGVGFLARVFMLDTLTGQPVWVEFFKLARRLAKEAGKNDLAYIPDDIWEKTGEQFPWEKWESLLH